MHQIHCLQRSGIAIQEEEVTRLEVPGDANGNLQRKWDVTTPNGQAWVRERVLTSVTRPKHISGRQFPWLIGCPFFLAFSPPLAPSVCSIVHKRAT